MQVSMSKQQARGRRKAAIAASTAAGTTKRTLSGASGGPRGGRKVYTVVTLPASNRGRNARGSTGAKRGWGGSPPKGAKRAKRQGADRMGNVPRISRTNWGNV